MIDTVRARPLAHRMAAGGVVLAALLVSACSVDMGGFAFTDKAEVTSATTRDPVLNAEGTCDGTPKSKAQAIEIGIAECDIVRLKGQPTDVMIGESGKGQREVQVLYSDPGNKQVYLFTDNRLTKIVQ